MGHSILELTDWLQEKKGQTVFIIKEELATGSKRIMDMDELKLDLMGVSLKESMDNNVDDYVENQELILQGSGIITSDNGEAELPNNMYEIPLLGMVTTKKDENGMKLETEKAVYTFSV